jgi:phage-related protein/SLT domain-containing protein
VAGSSTSLSYDILATTAQAARAMEQLSRHLERLSDKLDEIDGRRAEADVDVDSAAAEARLAAVDKGVSRLDGRRAEVKVDVDKGFGAVMGKLGSLSGMLAKIGLPAAGVMASANAVMGLSAVVADLSGLLGVATAAAAAGGAVFATLKVGTHGLGDAMKAVGEGDAKKLDEALKKLAPSARAVVLAVAAMKPQWDKLQLDVQQRLFAGVGKEVSALGKIYLPILRTGMDAVADSTNKLIHATANYLKTAKATGDVRVIFDNTAKSMSAMQSVGSSLSSVFLDVAAVGSKFLPGLAAGFAQGAAELSAFVEKSKQSGALAAWMQRALDASGQLWEVLKNIGGSLGGLFRASGAEGEIFLINLVNITGAIKDAINSVSGQEQLGLFFAAAAEVSKQLGDVLRTAVLPVLGQVIASLAPLIAQLADGLAPIIKALAPLIMLLVQCLGAILVPIIQTLMPVILALVNSLAAALAPILPPLAAALILVVNACSPLIAVLGELTPILVVIAEAALGVVQALVPIIATIAHGMTPIFQALIPVIMQVVQIIGGALIQVVNALAPLFPPLIAAIAAVASAFGTALLSVLQALAPMWPLVISALVQILAAVLPIVPVIAQFAAQLITQLAPILPPLITAFLSIVQALLPLLPVIMQLITALLPPFLTLITALAPVVASLAQILGDILTTVIRDLVVPILTQLIQLIQGVLVPVLDFLEKVIQRVFENAGIMISTAWNAVIKPVFEVLCSFITGTITPTVQTLLDFWNRTWSAMGAWISSVWNNNILPVWNALVSFITVTIPDAFTRGVDMVRNIWDGIKAKLRDPIVAVVDVVYNKGIVAMWQKVADFLHLPGLATYTVPGFASGGPVRGGVPGKDSVPLLGMPGEYILSKTAVERMGGVGQVDAVHSALRAAGGASPGRNLAYQNYGGDEGNPGLAYRGVGMQAGGAVGAALAYARSQAGKPYQWAGVGNPSFDCSGFMSAIQCVLQGMPVHRLYSTASFAGGRGAAGLVPGHGAFTVGVRQGNPGHMAGNLAGTPVESNGRGVTVGSGSSVDSFPAQFFLPQVGGQFIAGGGGGFTIDPLTWLKEKIGDMLGLADKLPGGSPYLDAMKGFGGKIAKDTWDFLLGKAKEFIASIASSVGGAIAGVFGGGSGQAAVQAAAQAYGWGSGAEWTALQYIVSHESGFNPTAQNPTSTAFGMFQFLDSTWGSVGGSKTSDPGIQAALGMKYIQSRYGDPINAQSFWNSHHWYANGGIVTRPTFGLIGEAGPEAIVPLSRPGAASRVMGAAGLGGDGLTVIVSASESASAERLVSTALHQARLRRLAGRYVGAR